MLSFSRNISARKAHWLSRSRETVDYHIPTPAILMSSSVKKRAQQDLVHLQHILLRHLADRAPTDTDQRDRPITETDHRLPNSKIAVAVGSGLASPSSQQFLSEATVMR